MAEYNVHESISGAWAKGDNLRDVKYAKIVSEVKPMVSRFTNEDGTVKMQDVGKVLFKGLDEPLNLALNKTTLNGLVRAFGKDSTKWMNQVLSVETEKVRVAGKASTAIYLIPAGFHKVDDENGYAAIVPKVGEGEQPAPDDGIPTINVGEDDVNPNDVPF